MSYLKVSLLLTILAAGCSDLTPPPPSAPAKPKTTTDIGEFDPDAGSEVVEPKIHISNPITGALEAYGPMRQKIAGMGIEYAIRLFQASEGRYPKDHEEFMTKIIAANNMRLPVLPQGLKYQYDVENHKLVVIREDNGEAVE
jgi:hypothetical protein